MEYKNFGGKIGDLPIGGSSFNFSDQDFDSLIDGAGSLAKSLLVVGGLGFAFAILAVLLGGPTKYSQKISIGSMCRIKTRVRDRFWAVRDVLGICVTPEILFTCGSENFFVPPSHIHSINNCLIYRNKVHYTITTIDGSSYYPVTINNDYLDFLTIAGSQRIYSHKITIETQKKKYLGLFPYKEDVSILWPPLKSDDGFKFVTGVVHRNPSLFREQIIEVMEEVSKEAIQVFGPEKFQKLLTV